MLRRGRHPAPLAAALAAALGLGACGGPGDGAAAARAGAREERKGDRQAAEEAIPVHVAAVRRDAVSSIYSTSATLRADKRATVIARTQGIVQRLLAEEGHRVAVGQALAHLEDEEERIAAERARATREAKARELARIQRLHAQGLVSDEAYETVRREAADAEHAAALTQLALSRTVIRAPFAGIILRRHVDVGATVTDGTAIFELADLAPLYADINVPERHVGRLEPGQEVRLTGDASGEALAARIERIAPAIDPETGTVKVTVAVEDSVRLRPGAFVRVDIVTATRPDALVVPRSALVAEGRRWTVFRLGADGETVERLEVGLGFEEGDRVEIAEIRSPGEPLAAGDRVVVAGGSGLTDGTKVKVVEEPPG